MVTESLVNPNLQETEFQNTLWKVDDQVSEKPVPLGRHGLVMKKLQRFRPAGAGSTEQSLLAQTVASKDAVAVMIDSQVLLFCSKGQSFLSSIILDCRPTCVTFSETSQFMVIGDVMGAVHFVDIRSKSIVFSQEFAGEAGKRAIKHLCVAHDERTGFEDLFISLGGRTLYHFWNIDFRTLRKALEESNLGLAFEVKKRIRLEQLLIPHLMDTPQISDLDVYRTETGFRLQVAASSGLPLSLWLSDQKKDGLVCFDSISDRCFAGFQKTRVHGHTLLTLDTNNRLLLWELEWLIALRPLCENVIDFELLPSAILEKSGSPGCLLEALLRPSDSGDHLRLLVYKYPAMEVLLDKLVPMHTSLARSRHTSEHIYFTSVGTTEAGQACIELLSFSVALPGQNLRLLLEAGEFEKALEAAAVAGVSKQIVFQEKLRRLCQSSGNESGSLSETVELIEDSEFLLNFCNSVESSDSVVLRQLFDLVASVLLERDVEVARLCPVSSAIHRLSTYDHLKSSGALSSSWVEFRNAKLRDVVQQFVRRGEMVHVEYLWSRHSHELTIAEGLVDLLNQLPDSLEVSAYRPWLENCILPSLSSLDMLLDFAEWIQSRVRRMQLGDTDPTNALQLVRVLDESGSGLGAMANWFSSPSDFVNRMAQSSCGFRQSVAWKESLTAKNFEQLRMQLEDMLYLRKTHQLSLSLNDYVQETPSSIATLLLDRAAAPESLADAISSHFRPYLARHGFPGDNFLLDYAMELLDRPITTTVSSTEAKVVVVLDHIENKDVKLDVLLELMRRSSIPWSSELDARIKNALHWNSQRRHEELLEQLRLMDLRKMLIEYGIRNFNISDLSLARGLVKFLVSKTSVPHALQDAAKVVDAYHHLNMYDAMIWRVQYLCRDGKMSEVAALLSSIGLQEMLFVGQESAHWLLGRLLSSSDRDGFAMAIEALVLVAQTLRQRESSCFSVVQEDNSNQLFSIAWTLSATFFGDVERLSLLFREFGLQLSLSDLQSVPYAKKLLKDYVQGLTVPTFGQDLVKLYKLTDCLRLSKAFLLSRLAKHAASTGNVRHAIIVCKELANKAVMDSMKAQYLLKIAKALTKLVQCSRNFQAIPSKIRFSLTVQIQQLSQLAVMCAQVVVLTSSLDAFKKFELQNRIFAQCGSGTYDISLHRNPITQRQTTANAGSSSQGSSASQDDVDSVSVGQVANELFPDHFTERGLVLDTSATMTVIAGLIQEHFHQQRRLLRQDRSRKPHILYNIGEAFKFVQYLQQNRVFQLAVLTFLHQYEFFTRVSSIGYGGPTLSSSAASSFKASHLHELLEAVLVRVLQSKTIDAELALGYMVAVPTPVAFNSFRSGLASVGTNYERLIRLASIGVDAAALWQQRSFAVECRHLASNARWWQQLKLLEIPFDDNLFRNCRDGSYQQSLLPAILHKTSLDVDCVVEYCRAFNISEDVALFEFFTEALTQFSLGPASNPGYHRSPGVLDRISALIPTVDHKAKLKELLTDIVIKRLSFYDYECIDFVIRQLTLLDPDNVVVRRGALVLDVLRHYTRSQPPTSTELAQCTNQLADHAVEPDKLPFAGTRLPLQPTVLDSWSVIELELSLESLAKLLPLCVPLNMNPDDFYVRLIRKMMSVSGVITSEVKPLVKRIRNVGLAISVIREAAQTVNCATERINLLKFAVNTCEMWKHQESEESGEAEQPHVDVLLSELRLWHNRIETEAQLRTLEFNDLLSLADQPNELIIQLYETKSDRMFGPSRLSGRDLPVEYDLHAVVNEIASRHGIDADKLRQQLLLTWLLSPFDQEPSSACSQTSQFDSSALPSVRYQIAVAHVSSREGLLQWKLLYMLRYGPVEKSAAFLIQFATQQKAGKKVTSLTRIRALQVLFQLLPPGEKKDDGKLEELRGYMRVLFYLADFEELDIQQSVKEFQSCSKEGLVRGLWRDYHRDPRALYLICSVCLDFGVHDAPLWQSVVSELLNVRAYPFTLSVLDRLQRAWPSVLLLPSVPAFWDRALLGFAEKCCTGSDVGQSVSELCSWLSICPRLDRIDLRGIFQLLLSNRSIDFCQLAKFLLASNLRCLRSEETTALVERLNKDTLGAALSDIVRRGFDELAEAVILYADEHQWYGSVFGWSAFKRFVQLLVRQDKIDGLLRWTLKLGRLQEAENLITMYYSVHPNLRNPGNECCTNDLLQMYLTTRVGMDGLQQDVSRLRG